MSIPVNSAPEFATDGNEAGGGGAHRRASRAPPPRSSAIGKLRCGIRRDTQSQLRSAVSIPSNSAPEFRSERLEEGGEDPPLLDPHQQRPRLRSIGKLRCGIRRDTQSWLRSSASIPSNYAPQFINPVPSTPGENCLKSRGLLLFWGFSFKLYSELAILPHC